MSVVAGILSAAAAAAEGEMEAGRREMESEMEQRLKGLGRTNPFLTKRLKQLVAATATPQQEDR